MPNFKVEVPHDSEREQVVQRLRGFAENIRDDLPINVTNIEETWDQDGNLNFSFEAIGFRISGNMITCTRHVTVQGKIPFAALPFRGAIETQVAETIRQAIDRD